MNFLLFIFAIFASSAARGESGYDWSPKKRIEISVKELVLDGNKVVPLKCSSPDKAKVGKLTLKADSFSVSCKADYLGGFYIHEDLLAQRDADAGDSWDTQSLIFFDETSKAWIWSLITYSTSDLSVNCDGQSTDALRKQGWSEQSIEGCKNGKIDCRKVEKIKKWDDQSKIFSDHTFKGQVPQRKLKPFPRYLDICK